MSAKMNGSMPIHFKKSGTEYFPDKITPHKLALLRLYAHSDAENVSIEYPSTQTKTLSDEALMLARFMASSNQFFQDDRNLDNQKRNITIRVFIDFSFSEIRRRGRAFLDRWNDKNNTCHWFLEWRKILDSATDDELARVLLSPDEESTRLRLSAPFSGMLDVNTAFHIKRSGMPI